MSVCNWAIEPLFHFLTNKDSMIPEKLSEIEWRNPWETFKKGKLPIGLAAAFRDKHGYDPLKACRLYIWLGHVRSFAWYWLAMSLIYSLTAAPGLSMGEIKNLTKSSFVVRLVIILTIALILTLIFSRRTYKRCKLRMWDFRRSIVSFVHSFSLFEQEPQGFTGSTKKDELKSMLEEEVAAHTRAIAEGEVTGKDSSSETLCRAQKVAVAAIFGLADGMEALEVQVRAAIDSYALFDWKI